MSPDEMPPPTWPRTASPGELRRNRLAQVPAAFWIEDRGFTILCFRSVARYVFGFPMVPATPGGEVGLWRR